MRIIPYTSVSDIPFGCTKDAIIALLGVPNYQNTNKLNQLELIYDLQTFRLSEYLVEVTVCSEYFNIENCYLPASKGSEVSFVELGFIIAKLDQESFFAHGFIVSPRFGIAFDPHFPSYLTVFAKTELSAWKAMA